MVADLLAAARGAVPDIAVSTDVTPRYVEADPFEGGKQAVAECWRNLTAVGSLPIAITDNLNFGNPERPEIMGQFVKAIEGISAACRALDFPVVSGNVSVVDLAADAVVDTVQTASIAAPGSIEEKVAVGVAQMLATDSAEEIFRRVDRALYMAKESGRNCVVAL